MSQVLSVIISIEPEKQSEQHQFEFIHITDTWIHV